MQRPALYFENNNSDDLADKIESVIFDNELRKNIFLKVKCYQKFILGIIVQKILSMFMKEFLKSKFF